MKHVIYEQDGRVLAWAAAVIGDMDRFTPDAKAIGVANGDGMIVGATVWDVFSHYNCMMSVASDGTARWATPEFVYQSFAYPFIQLGLLRATAIVRADNRASLHLVRNLGFEVEAPVLRRMFGDVDGIGFVMLREHCRFIQPKFMKRVRIPECADG